MRRKGILIVALEVLTPEQRKKFVEIRARWKQCARTFSGRGH